MRILVATDGSRFSTAALEQCCAFFGQVRPIEIRVISVYEAQVPIAAEPFAISAEYYQRLDNFARQRSESVVDTAITYIRSKFDAAVIELSSKIEMGRPAEVISDEARLWNADVVVVGSHGRGFWGRLTLGSVSDAVIHHAPCTVMVVRKGRGPSEE